MKYQKTTRAVFIERPNRFIAYCSVNGERVKCHVKNTGRCKELLLPGVNVILSESDNPERSTRYDLVAVYKGSRLVNIDSQAPNQAVKERFSLIHEYDELKPEYTFGESRFDFSAICEGRRMFAEVKGVTQECCNHVMFPDAPTERGLKHVRELTRLAHEGYECFVVFVIQMGSVDYFIPNYQIHYEFGQALREAEEAGVKILAFDCDVKEGSMDLGRPVEVRF